MEVSTAVAKPTGTGSLHMESPDSSGCEDRKQEGGQQDSMASGL